MWSDISLLWFAFPWWLVILTIFSCWSSVCFLWKNVYSLENVSFSLGCLYFLYQVLWDLCIFWILIPYQIHPLQIICRWPFHFIGFPSLCENFYFDVVSFVYFYFCFLWLRIYIQKMLLKLISRSKLPMFSCRSFMISDITSTSLICFGFCICCEKIVYFDSFQSSCPIFSIVFIVEAVLSPLYILASLVIN